MTLYEHAQRYVGEVFELQGEQDHPFIQWCLMSCSGYENPDVKDEIPWCSAFINRMAWDLRLPRSKSAAARSWLEVGVQIGLQEAIPGQADVVIIKQAFGDPGPEVLQFRGHVGLLAGAIPGGSKTQQDPTGGAKLLILGGNQSNGISVVPFPLSLLLGLRRLAPPQAPKE